MGLILNAGFQYLINSCHSWREYSGKSCLMLGRQDTAFTYADLIDSCAVMGFELNPELLCGLSSRKRYSTADSYEVFRWIGFDHVSAMDISGYEGADILHDLNEPVGRELYDRFDVIFDGGTLEHLFDIKTALSNISVMAKKGCRIIHSVPAANWCDHGFYSFSPTMFLDYYTANHFIVNTIYIYVYNYMGKDVQYQSPDCRLCDIQAFLANKLDMNEERALLVCVVSKTTDSCEGKVPVQSMYVSMHQQNAAIECMAEYLSQKGYENIMIYGSGQVMHSVVDYLGKNNTGINVVGLLDQDIGKVGSVIHGHKVYSFADMPDKVDCIVIASFKFADKIAQRLGGEQRVQSIEVINMKNINI